MNKIALIYAYTVCLTSIVSCFVASAQLIMNGFEYASPLDAPYYYEGNASQSFDTYRLDHQEMAIRNKRTPLSDSDLRRLYEERKNAQVRYVHYEARRNLTAYSLLLLGSVVLFLFHFLWARKMVTRAAESA